MYDRPLRLILPWLEVSLCEIVVLERVKPPPAVRFPVCSMVPEIAVWPVVVETKYSQSAQVLLSTLFLTRH